MFLDDFLRKESITYRYVDGFIEHAAQTSVSGSGLEACIIFCIVAILSVPGGPAMA